MIKCARDAEDSHRRFVSRDDGRGARLAARRRAARSRSSRASGDESLAGSARIFPLARDAALQDPRADPARKISPLRALPRLQRRASSSPRRSMCCVEGQSIAQIGQVSVRELPAWIEKLRKKRDDRGARRAVVARTRKSRRLSQRSRARLSDARTSGAHAFRRRGAANPSRERARQPAIGHALRAR